MPRVSDPYYSQDGITIYHGDCRDILPQFPDKSFDLVLTDPPYGVGFRENEWDKEIPRWLEEAKRVSDVTIFTTAPVTLWDYPRPDWVGCYYREAANSRSLFGGFNHWTPLVFYGKPKRLRVDSKKLHALAINEENGHPTPKPVELMSWLIDEVMANSILDPFMGSGTTLVAAKQLGRKAVGIEIEERYCEIAVKRLAQMELFGRPIEATK